MPRMTTEDYIAFAEGCDLNNPTDNIKLLMHEHTPAIINPMINTRMAKNRNCNYFMKMFETAVQPDGQRFDEINDIYHSSYIPKSFSFLTKTSQPCDPLSADACARHFCEIPSGGRSTMPQGQWFSWGLKTKPYCLQNFREINRFLMWLGKEAEDRANASAVQMELFYLQVFLLTAGHKIVLEGKPTGGNGYIPFPSADPRNPLSGYKYNWMNQYFPAVDDANNILPLDVAVLQRLGRNWSENTNTAPTAFNGESNGLYTLWIGDDWRAQEVDRFEDFSRLFGTIENEKMLEGYRFEEGSKTTFGRFILESRFKLPRFACEETTGNIVMVQDQVPINAEVGFEHILNPLWMDAPFRLAVSPTRDQATVLTRPPLTVHGNGIPIPAVPSSGGWYPKNEYDKDCNPHRLLPHWESWNEMGYRPKNPDGAMALLYRARTFLSVAQNYCDLAPLFCVTSPDDCDSFTVIGCENKRSMPNGITAQRIGQTDVRCSSTKCGSDTTYRIEVESLAPLSAGSRAINAECGEAITVLVEDINSTVREVQAVLIDTDFAHPYGTYSIELADPLDSGDCIRAVRPNGATPTLSLVTHSIDVAPLVVKFSTASAIVGAVAGGNVNVSYYDSSGVLLGVIAGEIDALNNNLFHYTVSSIDPTFASTPSTAWAANIDSTKTTITLA